MVVGLAVALDHSVGLPDAFAFELDEFVGDGLYDSDAHLVVLGLVVVVDHD